MSTVELWPARASFAPGEPVVVHARSDRDVDLALDVSRLGEPVRTVRAGLPAGDGAIELGTFDVGGYAVADGVAATAFDVLRTPMDRPRYGFLSEFGPERGDPAPAVDGLLKLHLNVVQFYDWMHRHADLVADGDEFDDALGRRLSHATARRLATAVRDAGALPLGYAAVYGVGREHADAHPEHLLYHADGSPWMLSDFLWIGDISPTNGWRAHIVEEFRRAVAAMGFAGLHLDQYGFPQTAYDAAGRPVDLTERFPELIAAVRDALPEATLIFNNVNDFPTWLTATAPQDATYIEPWDPHTTYGHLAGLIRDARAVAPDRPVILAAYLEPFRTDTAQRAAWAARLALATVFAHGGHYLLCGEGDAVLTDPYYPNFRRVDGAAFALLRRYFDFAVALGDLLYDPRSRDVTRAVCGGVNDEVEVLADVPVSVDPLPGHLWVTVCRGDHGLTVQLIDLSAQHDAAWNAGKEPGGVRAGVRVRARWPSARAVAGTPEDGPALTAAPADRDGDHLDVAVPPFQAWATVHLPRAA